ncbi:MAG: 2Fe-2S iron-sulfur cluster-binding protein [Thiobacillaceae bacterium]|nr:2Fe-2S iron-sulfur cluster-binding protein [Thiobacillaceae bacterium]MCX7673336.1 2Fe-2S iron-sulfur cluster-binding protein [Thiobacillaceae bacterium]MDW8322704.1 2Fe-2S iron-sulfur cluster-binding protein [Burkholderiales bacterium]
MSHTFSLSRVARLVGVPRSTLQRMVKEGRLTAQNGEVEMEELLRVFPDVKWEDDGEYARVEEIKKKAFAKRIFERALPDKEVLADRLFDLTHEYATAKGLLAHYEQLFEWVMHKLDDVAEAGGAPAAQAVADCKLWLRQQLAAAPREAERARGLLAEERAMRIVSVQVKVLPSGHEFFVEGSDTILEAALRAGIPLNYGCSNGNCGECRARLVAGEVKKVHPHDYVLKEADKAQGAFLMCSYTAVSDIVIEAAVAGAQDIPHQVIATRVKAVELLDERLAALHLTTPRSQRLRFLAGQRVRLKADGVEGEYYLASCPCEDRHLELHVRRDNRPFARRVFDGLRKEDPVTVEGPEGSLVINLDSRRPVIFVAWDDGFAPIKSLVQHAMSLELAEHMHLYWVAADLGHYQDNLCRSWADALDNFTYVPLWVDGGAPEVAARILDDHPDLSHTDLYAAGPAQFLQHLRDGAMARGLSPRGWHAEVLA